MWILFLHFPNYEIPFIVSWILFFLRSTLITFTSTISPTLTTSSGCLMNFLSVISEMCTSPSWCTPISTNTPKSMTFLTVHLRIMTSFKSFISKTSVLKIGFGISSRGSRPGFSSSFTISRRVISPISSSFASLA